MLDGVNRIFSDLGLFLPLAIFAEVFLIGGKD